MGGESQTAMFAKAQLPLLPQVHGNATLLDFGCGLGDAIPVYHAFFPSAKLFGVDHSETAVQVSRERYGHLARFATSIDELGDKFDYIVCSNVLEHVDDHLYVAEYLLTYVRCALVVVAPFLEAPLDKEHVRQFDRDSMNRFRPSRVHVFGSPGWTEYGVSLFVNVWLGNALRFLFGKPLRVRRMQIMYVVEAPTISGAP